MRYAFYYLILISLVAVFITVHDKRAAKKHKRRIPEKTLFVIALLGGAFAMYLTMLAVRHKTLHRRFMLGLPLITVLHIVCICLLLKYFIV